MYTTFLSSRCRKLPKALKEWQAFLDLKKKIDDFNECCPLLEMMANKAMMNRHWDRIATLTGHTFDVESDGFLLRNIMMAPLLENKEDIEVWWIDLRSIHTCQLNCCSLIGLLVNTQIRLLCPNCACLWCMVVCGSVTLLFRFFVCLFFGFFLPGEIVYAFHVY